MPRAKKSRNPHSDNDFDTEREQRATAERYRVGGEMIEITDEEAYGTTSFAEDDLETMDTDLSALMYRHAVAAPPLPDGSPSAAKNIPSGCRRASDLISHEETRMFGGYSNSELDAEEELDFDNQE